MFNFANEPCKCNFCGERIKQTVKAVIFVLYVDNFDFITASVARRVWNYEEKCVIFIELNVFFKILHWSRSQPLLFSASDSSGHFVTCRCRVQSNSYKVLITYSTQFKLQQNKMDNVDAKNTKKSKEVAKDVLKELFHFHLSHTIALRSLSDILIFLDITKNLTNSCL